MRLQNANTLLCWPSRMHNYGFVEDHTFFHMMEQFVSMGGTRTFFYMMEQFDRMRVSGHFTIH